MTLNQETYNLLDADYVQDVLDGLEAQRQGNIQVEIDGRKALADAAQAGAEALLRADAGAADARAMGVEALSRADPDTRVFARDAERTAATGTGAQRAFTLESRSYHEWDGSVWQPLGSAIPSFDEVNDVRRTLGVNLAELVRPGMGAAQVSAALAAGLQRMKTDKQTQLVFPAQKMIIGETWPIDATDTHLSGAGGASWVGNEPGWEPAGTIISGAAGVAELLRVTFTKTATHAYGSFSTEGITYLNENGAQTAIYVDSKNGPPRPLRFTGTFMDFPRAIVFDASDGITCAANVEIANATFKSSTPGSPNYAIYCIGQGALVNSRIVNNASEWGGRFLLHLMGTCTIEDNIPEGQPDPFEIYLHGCQLYFGRQYLEHNSGVIRITATNLNDTTEIAPQYVFDCPRLHGELIRGRVRNHDVFLPWRPRACHIEAWQGRTLGVQRVFDVPAAVANTLEPDVLAARPAPAGVFVDAIAGSRAETGANGLVTRYKTVSGASGMVGTAQQTGPRKIITAAFRVRSSKAVSVVVKWYKTTGDFLCDSDIVDALPGEQVVLSTLQGVGDVAYTMVAVDVVGDTADIGEITFYTAEALADHTAPEPAERATEAWYEWQTQMRLRAFTGVPLYIHPGSLPQNLDTTGIPLPAISGLPLYNNDHAEKVLGSTPYEVVTNSYAALRPTASGLATVRIPELAGYKLVGANWTVQDGNSGAGVLSARVGDGFVMNFTATANAIYAVTVQARWFKA